jgi:pyrroloquinoline quinone biosynthesis protein E
MDSPFGLLAELTYRCPLACAYCSNPLNLADYQDELTTQEWRRVLVEARDLGVLQCHLSGGEPLLRRDLVEIVAGARELGLYTNLVTSAIGLSRPRAEQLRAAGLDHVQVSIQADEPAVSDRIAGTPSFRRKVEAMGVVKELGWPLTVNVVLHRQNIDRVADLLGLAEEVGADRVELANTQYYGWAWRNRDALLPSRAQLEAAEVVVRAARERLRDRMDVIYVIPDYYSRYPKPCMGGWASRQLTVTPNGDVLPCPAAQTLPLPRANVREDSLEQIWTGSPVMTAFRGTGWMPDPCRSCNRRELDFGGCRCQAFQLTGDAARTDPVCHLSPDHELVARAVEAANADPPAGDRAGPPPAPGPQARTPSGRSGLAAEHQRQRHRGDDQRDPAQQVGADSDEAGGGPPHLQPDQRQHRRHGAEDRRREPRREPEDPQACPGEQVVQAQRQRDAEQRPRVVQLVRLGVPKGRDDEIETVPAEGGRAHVVGDVPDGLPDLATDQQPDQGHDPIPQPEGQRDLHRAL